MRNLPHPSLDDGRRLDHPGALAFRVRPRRLWDVEEVARLMGRVYPPPHPPGAVWSPAVLAEHLRHFPEGQLLAETPDGRIVADSTSLRVSLQRATGPHTWSQITGSGRLSCHEPRGEAFYGVDIAVDPPCRGQGVASCLYRARFALARRLGCRVFAAGARIPGYHLVAPALSPERYVLEVAAGLRVDPTLSRQLHLGFQVAGLLPDYFEDFESGNCAVLILRPLGPP